MLGIKKIISKMPLLQSMQLVQISRNNRFLDPEYNFNKIQLNFYIQLLLFAQILLVDLVSVAAYIICSDHIKMQKCSLNASDLGLFLYIDIPTFQTR
jgi:uncharacterized membrane protein YjgN (DUF898 family)